MTLIFLMLGAALVGGMASLVLLGLHQEWQHQRAIIRDEKAMLEGLIADRARTLARIREELIAQLPKLPETWGPK